MNGTAERMTGVRWTTRVVVRVYRLTGGRMFGTRGGKPVMLLTTVGRHTGSPRTTPVVFGRDSGRFVLAASGDDAAGDSAWADDLQVEPSARVEIAAQSWEVRATPGADGSHRVFVLEPVT